MTPPQLDRPAEVDSNQIETLTDNDQHYTMWEIGDILKISQSTKLLVKMKNESLILWENTHLLFGQPNRCNQVKMSSLGLVLIQHDVFYEKEI